MTDLQVRLFFCFLLFLFVYFLAGQAIYTRGWDAG